MVTRLRKLELESMTPLEALNILERLQGEARRREGPATGGRAES
jgi:hypothetical protein